MPLSMGSRLGPYEILGAIGAGGMGEVYRARDTNLGRDAAIKVLPDAFARDIARMARFSREAKLLAALDHPNIASIYGLETSGDTRALVMQLAEGPTLADRIRQGPLPPEDALQIAKQIADALEYAHERGIVHRDLKPANVKVAPDDTVKILDFGLAKAMESELTAEELANSPTLSHMATQAGMLLGTAAYMSPEQAKAKPVDRRADIWAFGCVLYEMLTGKTAFHGDTVTDTLAAVIRAEPDYSLLPAVTPMRVRVLLQRCLQKDAKQRLRDIGDARISLDEVLSGAPEATPPLAAMRPNWRRAVPWALLSVTVAALAALAFVHFREKTALPAQVQRFEISAPGPAVNRVGALSPDGTRLVLISSENPSRLWLRRMDSLEAHPLEGTDGVGGVPFWSADSRFIAFGADGKLEKIEADGGPAQVLCATGQAVVGGFWTEDRKIVFGDPTRPPGMWEVPVAGGISSPLQGVERGNPFLYSPLLLPDRRHFLYMNGSVQGGDVYLGSLDSKPGQQSSKKLIAGVAPGLGYAASPDDPNLGYLLIARATAPGATTGTLMAQPLDLRKIETVGEPAPIAEQISSASASLTGVLVFGSGGAAPEFAQLTLFDRQGKVLGTVGETGNFGGVTFSPDGRRVAAVRVGQSGANLWMSDLERGTSSRFTFASALDVLPIWSPDGKRVAFSSNRGGPYDLYQKLSNGGGDDELLFKSDLDSIALSWSEDGRYLLFGQGSEADATIMFLPLDGNGHAAGKPLVFAQKGTGIDGKFSPGPQGHPLWVAYASQESGRYEVYVRPFDPTSPTGTPPGGGKWQVSTQGGSSPRWNGNSKELFYVAADGTVMSVQVSGASVFQAGIPKPLFKPKGTAQQSGSYYYWDASSDGKKFIFPLSTSANAAAAPVRFTVVLNWPALLKK